MKISCQSCGQKYALDDSKVRGKTKKFGVKCPGCGKVIVVNPAEMDAAGGGDGEAPAAAREAPPSPPSPPPPRAKAPAPPAPEAPASDDPFGGINFDNIGGAKEAGAEEPPAPPAAEEPGFDFADSPPPPAAAQKAAPKKGAPPPAAAAAPEDPFDFGNVESPAPPAEGGDSPGGMDFDMGGGGESASPSRPMATGGKGASYGEISFGEEGASGGEAPQAEAPSGGNALDELDRIDREAEQKAKKGVSADAFFSAEGGSGATYRLKNARGQVAGPFTIEAVREFALQGKFTGEEQLSRNEGPWISTSEITSLSDIKRVNLDQFLAEASAKSAPEMDAVSFSDEEMAASEKRVVSVPRAKLPLGVIGAVLALVVLAGGGWYWWAFLREVPLDKLSDQKIAELVRSGRAAAGSRAQKSEAAFQEGDAILNRLGVEEFPKAEQALLTAVQKNPLNLRAVAELGRLEAEWAALLNERGRASRAQLLADLAREKDPALGEALAASSEAYRVLDKVDQAVQFGKQAAEKGAHLAAAHVALARALAAKGGADAEVDAALAAALSAEAESQGALLTLAAVHEKRRQWDQALGKYDQAIDSRPSNVLPRYLKAKLLFNLGKHADALAVIEEAVKQPALAQMGAFNAQVLVLRAGLALAVGNAQEATNVLAKAEAASPGRADILTARGDVNFKTEKYADAIIEYQKATAADANYAPALVATGRTKIYLGDPAAAEQSLRKAILLEPANVEAHLLLGETLSKQQKFEEATKEFDAVLTEQPDNAVAYAKKGQMLAATGAKDAATDLFLRAINLDPSNAAIYLTVGSIFADLGKLEEATQHTRKAVELAPDSVEAKAQLGHLLVIQEKFGEAASLLAVAHDLNPKNLPIIIDLAKAGRAVRDFEGAKKVLLQGRELQASNIDVRYLLGRTYYDLKDFENAVGEMNRAVYYDAQVNGERPNAELHYWYGQSLRAQSKLPEAQGHLENAIKYKPDYLDAHFALGQLMATQGSPTRARDEFEKVLRINPRHMQAMLELGTVYKDSLRDPQKALDLFSQVIRQDKKNALASYRICQIFLDRSQPEKAISPCLNAAQSDPAMCSAWVELGFAYSGAGKSARLSCGAWKAALKCQGLEEYRIQDVKEQMANECQ